MQSTTKKPARTPEENTIPAEQAAKIVKEGLNRFTEGLERFNELRQKVHRQLEQRNRRTTNR
jgi:hypothetical protein